MSVVSGETQQKVGEEVRDCRDLPPSQQMAISHLPSASSRAAVSDAPATARTYSLRPGNGGQSCVPNVNTGAAERTGVVITSSRPNSLQDAGSRPGGCASSASM